MFWPGVILRFAFMITCFAALLFGAAGRFDIPAFWGWLTLFVVALPAMLMAAGRELMQERMKPGPGGADQLTRILALPVALSHLVVAGLDVGRFHWSDDVPIPLQIASFVALAMSIAPGGVPDLLLYPPNSPGGSHAARARPGF